MINRREKKQFIIVSLFFYAFSIEPGEFEFEKVQYYGGSDGFVNVTIIRGNGADGKVKVECLTL